MNIDILALIQSDGHDLKKHATTHSGEYAGPCPWCGGNDRFLVWPQYKGGRYWCRGCEKTGDAIQYIRDTRNLSYFEALSFLGIEKPRLQKQRRKNSEEQNFKPKAAILPTVLWMEKAARLLKWSQDHLWAPDAQPARDILAGKGLHEETIRAAGIGWNPGEVGKDLYRDRRGWGLPHEAHRDGRPKRLWIPSGLVIPLQSKEGTRRIRVRRNDPGEGPRYVLVAGSSIEPLVLGSSGKNIFVIVESELDGWLVFQEAGNMAGVVALGSANLKPDAEAHELLIRSKTILNALDYDAAGARYAGKFWLNTYGSKVIRWPVPIGKDPSDAWQQGLNIRDWIEAGLE